MSEVRWSPIAARRIAFGNFIPQQARVQIQNFTLPMIWRMCSKDWPPHFLLYPGIITGVIFLGNLHAYIYIYLEIIYGNFVWEK